MINVQLYHYSRSLNAYLHKFLAGSNKVTIICPNPVQADIARTKFASVHQEIESITIAKFLRDQLQQLLPKEQLENFQGKSDLNLLLGSLWKRYKSHLSYELFKRSFQILTDFRSFTLNEEILETLVENYDPELGGAVFWFHKILQQMDVIDEHRSYFLLSERLRTGDLPPLYESNRSYVFWGFDFMTASQIDLLHSLSIRNDVCIPFPSDAFSMAKDVDWIRWLTKTEATSIEIDHKHEDLKKIQSFTFPRNHLAKFLKTLQEVEFKEKRIDLVLGTKQLTEDYPAEVTIGEMSFKINVNLFEEQVASLKKYSFTLIEIKKELSVDEFLVTLQSYAQKLIEDQNFKGLKSTTILMDTVNQWKELSDNNQKINEFDIKIIFDSVMLDLPRNSIFVNNKKDARALRYLKTIEQESQADINLLCITSDYGPIKSSVIQYSDNVEKYLASIGPIRRGELEFLIMKSKIQEFLLGKNTYLVMEEGLTKSDLGWSRILPDSILEKRKLKVLNFEEATYFFPNIDSPYELESISASKFQTYLDCPRKFYLSYGLKQKPRIELPSELNHMQLGLIEHKVIEEYLKKYSTFDRENLESLILNLLLEYESKGKLQNEKREEYLLEIKAICTEIIKELITFNKMLGVKLEFEKELPANEELGILGSIDCFGINKDLLMMLDFKRGSGSIPSQASLKKYDKIQLWFYLNRMKKNQFFSENQKLIWGYINLSKLEDSQIYTNDEFLIDLFQQSELKMLDKVYKFDEEFYTLLERYDQFEQEKFDELRDCQSFPARPKNALVCQYCDLANICSRRVLEDVNGAS